MLYDDVGFLTVYRWIYCHKFMMLSDRMLFNICMCIRFFFCEKDFCIFDVQLVKIYHSYINRFLRLTMLYTARPSLAATHMKFTIIHICHTISCPFFKNQSFLWTQFKFLKSFVCIFTSQISPWKCRQKFMF